MKRSKSQLFIYGTLNVVYFTLHYVTYCSRMISESELDSRAALTLTTSGGRSVNSLDQWSASDVVIAERTTVTSFASLSSDGRCTTGTSNGDTVGTLSNWRNSGNDKDDSRSTGSDATTDGRRPEPAAERRDVDETRPQRWLAVTVTTVNVFIFISEEWWGYVWLSWVLCVWVTGACI